MIINQSIELDKFAQAFLAAQREMPNATLNKTNPHFRSKYADGVSVRDTILPVLNKHGLALTQGGDIWEGVPVVVTMLMHADSGQWKSFGFPIPPDLSAQQAGSAITYDRRYGASAIAYIFAEEDDDGNAAEEEKPAKQVAPPPAPKPAVKIDAPVNPKTGIAEPHAILFAVSKKGFGADALAWGQLFIAGIDTATTVDDVGAWERENAKTIVEILEGAPKIGARLQDRIKEAYGRVRDASRAAA